MSVVSLLDTLARPPGRLELGTKVLSIIFSLLFKGISLKQFILSLTTNTKTLKLMYLKTLNF